MCTELNVWRYMTHIASVHLMKALRAEPCRRQRGWLAPPVAQLVLAGRARGALLIYCCPPPYCGWLTECPYMCVCVLVTVCKYKKRAFVYCCWYFRVYVCVSSCVWCFKVNMSTCVCVTATCSWCQLQNTLFSCVFWWFHRLLKVSINTNEMRTAILPRFKCN